MVEEERRARVHRRDARQIIVCELEVEDVEVLRHPIGAHRLRDDDDARWMSQRRTTWPSDLPWVLAGRLWVHSAWLHRWLLHDFPHGILVERERLAGCAQCLDT